MNNSLALFIRKVRVALTPRSLELKTRFDNGATVAGPNKRGWGGRGAYVFRDDIEPELRLMAAVVPVKGVVIDVGANVGVYTYSAAFRVGKGGTVVAVEPFPQVYAQLYRNMQYNAESSSTVRLRCFGVSDHTGSRMLWLNEGRPHAFSLTRNGEAPGISVLVVRLDDLVRWEGIDRLDYLKVDAEGEEGRILIGGLSSLRRFRPIIQVEDVARQLRPELESYTRMYKSGRNVVFFPRENVSAIEWACESGWKPV
ncbi:MAG: FkbM family methyltransferase [Verrucomicrobia bacterium]|nr:FkbM family methyltransferase [Verrucomicrobiota bacterium]